jgi:D-xylonolactonase
MQLEIVADFADLCGENPLWHPLEKRLYWTDILRGRLYWYDPATGKSEQCYEGQMVGGFTFQADGSLLLFREQGNVVVWRNGKVLKTIVDFIPAERDCRFNDVIADPEGRVYCGTLFEKDSKSPRFGRLYRLDRDGSYTKMLDGVSCSNGLAFSLDLTKLYYSDSMVYLTSIFDYDRKTGMLSNYRPWVKEQPSDGFPDGMTIDTQGDIWSAHWDGYSIIRYDTHAKEKERIKFPVKKVSSCIFAGDGLTDMYVTTAGGGDKKENGPTAGALYRIRPGAKGIPEHYSKIGI